MAPDYKANDPRGWCGDPRRGAAMGRPSVREAPKDYAGKLYLRRVRLNGDYDVNGTYFGAGEPLYWCADSDGAVDFMLRARDRNQAKAKVRAYYPDAKFY